MERNALRAGIVQHAQHWRWSSVWRRLGRGGDPHRVALPLAIWPVEQPTDWLTWLNEPQTQIELDALRQSVHKGKPFGDSQWQHSTTKALGLESSHRPPGRPKKVRV